ncbi:MAG: hypothetical protein HY681_08220 [Chloroflexi bacterium]|nr:hypothetical protein [Chloroflexota bacterium]
MSFRVSFILIVLVAVVGGYVLLFELQKKPEPTVNAPWFYDVGLDEIALISVEHQGTRFTFESTPEGWVFQDTRQPVDLTRWSGIPLLLTGPRSSRVAAPSVENPKDYGLDPPQTVITVRLSSRQEIITLLGDVTPDGANHYAQVIGSDPLFLIPASWGNVISRLVLEPPYPTPTATPSADASGAPAFAPGL